MENLTLNCPLCCHKKFTSKQSLVEHLSNINEHLFCPVCSNKVTSLSQLTEHLRLDNCMPINYGQTIQFEDSTANTPANEYQNDNNIQINFKPVDHREIPSTDMVTDNNFTQSLAMDADDNKMQFDLCLQSQDLKFIKEDGENRFIFLTGDQDTLNSEGLVTKQNKDGTISVTTLKDIKMGSESVASKQIVEEQVVQEYSCSMCKMTFTSVYDHINNYHADQDVVVEGAMPESDDTLPIEYEPDDQEDNNDKQASRRVITDTGDIVEAPIVVKSFNQMEHVEDTPIVAQTVPNKLKEVPEKQGRGKRYVQIDKLCDSVIRELKPNQRNGPSHKVVIAAPLVMPDGESVKMYHCTSCDMYGNQLADFNTQSCKPAKYACTHCTMVYDNSKSLCAHMKVHKDKSVENVGSIPELYVCEICSTVFLTNKSLKLHKRMHEPVKARPIDPPRSSSSNGARYKCVTCDKLIPTDYREVHSKSHRYDNMLNCTICNKKFTSHDYLEMHMNVHNLDKAPEKKSDKTLPYSCVYCDRKFARPHEKVKHERIHTGEKPHSCEICGKSFRVSYCLTLHMRTHTGARPYACPHCDKRFKAHSVYNHHLLTHSEVRAYKCPFCPKAFKTSVQLAGHKNSHTKPFSCTQCNRPFASLYAVRVHTETHNRQNNLKFRCSLCGASYARAFALKDHIKQVHKQDTEKDPLTGTDDWISKGTSEADKDLGEEEVTVLEMPSELIVPN